MTEPGYDEYKRKAAQQAAASRRPDLVTRDLVDRTELRRKLDQEEGWSDPSTLQGRARREGIRTLRRFLDAMPSVECPRGWTRDEVLAELDTYPGAVCEWMHPLEVYRTALGLACSDGWSDGASAMQSYIETARDHIAARAALYPETGKPTNDEREDA